MHQTFYIDVDEEISSVIDRLRKSMAIDNYFVAPKRAIFLQSIVNLKLLKREADKMKKNVILVTQEEIVIAMATRSEIAVCRSMDELNEAQNVGAKYTEDDAEAEEEVAQAGVFSTQNSKSARLGKIGTTDFYEDKAAKNVQQPENLMKKNSVRHVSPKTVNLRGANSTKHVLQNSRHQSLGANFPQNNIQRGGVEKSKIQKQGQSTFSGLDLDKEKILEKVFLRKPQSVAHDNKQISNKKTKNFFFIFIVVSLFLLAGVAGYLYVPSADIIIKPSMKTVKMDADVIAEKTQQKEGSIPTRVINRQEQLTLQYNVTGKSSASGKKAQGSIAIYNEFDKQPQTLVATTRFQSEDGKIFRLLKTVIVPGMGSVDGQSKPGVISAEIVADQAGSEYNLQENKLTIPGFQGGPKYEKFYAKSVAAFSGGTTEGEASAGISLSDLENAKQKTEAALKEKIAAMLAGELEGDEVQLPAAEKITLEKSFSNAKVGDAISAFDYTATATVHALIFSQQDIKAILEKTTQFSEQPKNVSKEIKKIEYVSVDPNFENNTLVLKVHSELEITSKLDVEFFKGELLGKNETELLAVLKKNQTEIESVSVNFWPTFVNRTSQFPQRVNVEVEKR